MNFGDTSNMDAKVILGTASYHFSDLDRKTLNQYNPSIGFEAWDVQAVYVSKNSWSKKSAYVTYTPDYEVNEYITLTAQVGFATGYKCSNSVTTDKDFSYKGHEVSRGTKIYNEGTCSGSGVIPMAALTVELSPFGNGFNTSVSVTSTVAMFSIGYDF